MIATLRDAWFLARADFRHLIRRRETLLWAFALPVVFFYFLGTVTQQFSSDANQKDRLGIVLEPDAGPRAGQLIDRLTKEGFAIVRLDSRAKLADYRRRLTIPTAFSRELAAGHRVQLSFARTGHDMGGDYDQLRVRRAAAALTADIAGSPRTIELDVRPAGIRREAPHGFEQSVPGNLVFFVIMVLFTNGGVTLLLEREQGILRRLASSPMSRSAVMLGKWGARMLLGLIQIVFALATGSLLFGVRWGSNLPMVVLVLAALGGFAAATGMLVGNFSRTRGQAVAIGSITANVLAAIGGCWWPAEVTPPWMQTLARYTPAGLAMDALHRLVNFGSPALTVLPHLLAFTSAAAIAGWIVARTFRFE